jgi:hypothetical protein
MLYTVCKLPDKPNLVLALAYDDKYKIRCLTTGPLAGDAVEIGTSQGLSVSQDENVLYLRLHK